MATVKDIYDFIDSIAPFDTAEEWDNSGLLVGDEAKIVNKIIFALDVTDDIINQAVAGNADLIITHHPIIFKPVSNVLSDSLVYKLIKNDLSIICAHTNYDKAVDGVNDILCKTVGLTDVSKIDGTCLNMGYTDFANINDFADMIKSQLKGLVRFNSYKGEIKKVAVCSGAGSDYLETAKKLGCDVLLTGDGSHHSFLDSDDMGIGLVCAGHFETENIAINPLLEKIKNNFDIECILAIQNTPINAI